MFSTYLSLEPTEQPQKHYQELEGSTFLFVLLPSHRVRFGWQTCAALNLTSIREALNLACPI